MTLSAKAQAALVAFARATARAATLPSADPGPNRPCDVVLHSDQGVYRPDGSQQPFRRGGRSYVLVRTVPIAPSTARLVLVDETFRCGGAMLAQLLRAGYLAEAAVGRGYVLTAQGRERAAAATSDDPPRT